MEAAAELGRTLLERNRELESTVRQQQAVIDDQTQEMQVIDTTLATMYKAVVFISMNFSDDRTR